MFVARVHKKLHLSLAVEKRLVNDVFNDSPLLLPVQIYKDVSGAWSKDLKINAEDID